MVMNDDQVGINNLYKLKFYNKTVCYELFLNHYISYGHCYYDACLNYKGVNELRRPRLK